MVYWQFSLFVLVSVGCYLPERRVHHHHHHHRLSIAPSDTAARIFKISSTSLLASQDALPPSPLSESSPPQQQKTSTTSSSFPSFADVEDPLDALLAKAQVIVQPVVAVVSLSLLWPDSDILVLTWEEYGATNLWPSRHVIVETASVGNNVPFGATTIHGMGFGKRERLQLLEQQQEQQQQQQIITTDNKYNALLPEIRAYNEVMEEHRHVRVQRWTQLQSQQQLHQPQALVDAQMKTAVHDLQQVLLEVLELQTLVADYQWDTVHTKIQHDIVPSLEPSATTIRQYIWLHNKNNNNNDNPQYEIGFDWGSCAWRHCGALADAQEALDELDHLLGVLAPPECLFCLNVVERSLRDILAIVPTEYGPQQGVPPYKPYQSLRGDGSGDNNDETDVLDQEYLKMLQELRSSSATMNGEE